MNNVKKITDGIFWIGGSDRRLARFENIFPIPEGVSYNSYFIDDEKTAVFDTADITVADQYIENLKTALNGRKLDYLVVLHMEPDHCSLIDKVTALFPEVTVVGGKQTFVFMEQFFPESKDYNKLEVKEGDSLSTGAHTFNFVSAPMVHWPEVLFAYDATTKALLSADAFGTFGALDGGIFADEYDFEKQFLDSSRRYYANIVGKYGVQVQAVLKKAAGLDIQLILPLHGPVWRKDLNVILEKYQKWSTYQSESDGVIVVYGSLYGHTASAAEKVASSMRDKGALDVKVYDVSGTDVSYLIGEVWRAKKIVLMCPTYNGGIYPPMEAFINDMIALGVQNRTFALAQNGTWAPVTGKMMSEKLTNLKNVNILENVLTIKSALGTKDLEALDSFTDAICKA
ncbi:MAG: FprA family A-type flavoprotein [Butyrivibrio sp.]|uniref:FprA family A-type flavoprotein n=1 Tax=Butyrivibrio sp. TaxID=28121 RepID=UPI001B563DF1|nr:FprA family A-type flavoprotein [Butyrivibrio sp.]MBP3277421.1 FprA family A-type flavoprotein [Butyrivibrio sp.]MBP3783614.1 FprA family A-type flavoprotein [Butyrivibrio sp.]